jgi:hypothetical protein
MSPARVAGGGGTPGRATRGTVPPIRLLDERRYDPLRPVLVELDGRWWPGTQSAWRLCDDGRGWRADVRFVAQYDWGASVHVPTVPPERLKLLGDHGPLGLAPQAKDDANSCDDGN